MRGGGGESEELLEGMIKRRIPRRIEGENEEIVGKREQGGR